MNLSKKTFFYSILLSLMIVIMIVSYFVFLFPSLYVDHLEKNNYNSAVALQKQYVKERSYENLEAKNPTGTVTIDIPLEGNDMVIENKFFSGTVTIKDRDILDMLNKFRYYAKNPKEMPDDMDTIFDETLIKEKIDEYRNNMKSLPFSMKWNVFGNEEYEWEASSKTHYISDDFYVFESKIVQGGSKYTTYIIMTLTARSIVVTVMSVTTPDMEDITPVVFQSLPMIASIITLFVLLLSQVFSKWIITPIIRLSKHAEAVKRHKNSEFMPITLIGNDEITSLSKNLNELYANLRENFTELENNNILLSLENERQEVFLRAFSHQLKTPISAALLLVQGMYEEIGKFKNTKTYLPKVKEQLISMQKIVEDIIYLNHQSDHTKLEPQNLDNIIDTSLSGLDISITLKSITVETEGSIGIIETDGEMMKILLDNLLSNAINHSPDHGLIRIIKSEKELQIINYHCQIPEDILPHIFEPFVTSNHNQKGHGLGLYIVRYYSQFLKCQVGVRNIDDGVETRVTLES